MVWPRLDCLVAPASGEQRSLVDEICEVSPDHAGGRRRNPAEVDGANILWAAEVWFSIKKHWCLEAQQLIRARQTSRHGADPAPASSPGSVTLL